MTEFNNRICQALHREHEANVALLERVERLIAAQRGNAPNAADTLVRQLLSEFATVVSAEIERHFAFEERGLFPYLEALGNSAIGAHLTEEHSAIRPLVTKLSEMAGAAVGQGFDEGSWTEFRCVGGELCDRMLSHIEKEEMALLPLLEDSMNAETEARLCGEYLEDA